MKLRIGLLRILLLLRLSRTNHLPFRVPVSPAIRNWAAGSAGKGNPDIRLRVLGRPRSHQADRCLHEDFDRMGKWEFRPQITQIILD